MKITIFLEIYKRFISLFILLKIVSLFIILLYNILSLKGGFVMKIILLKDVKKQGKKGEILTVKDGFGTFLINKGDAILATGGSINRLAKENKIKEREELENIKKCEKLKKELEKITLKFKVKTGAQDKVFGSVSSKQIVDELKIEGYNVDKKQIKLENAISSLGFHSIEVELHKKVIANIKIELIK